ncbi:MAG: class I SAM-dependent methyltransferase [Deltaproteobacteria bacterium]|nr:class I SAM-dependent methyltransferase [Deltaproteobacteria bacterium]
MDINQAKEILGKQFDFIAEDANEVIQYLNLPQNAKILEVGTGMGYFAILLALNGYSVLTGEPESDDSIYAKKNWLSNAQKIGVDHLIKFKAFDAQNMLFDDNTFDAIFFFGVLHHIDEKFRTKVLKESLRTAKPNAVICFLEPNQNGIKIAKQYYPSHPEAADPSEYVQGLSLSLQKMKGNFFDSFIFRKERT